MIIDLDTGDEIDAEAMLTVSHWAAREIESGDTKKALEYLSVVIEDLEQMVHGKEEGTGE